MKVCLLKRAENTVSKGDIPHYEQFLLLSQFLFRYLSASDVSIYVCMCEKFKRLSYCHPIKKFKLLYNIATGYPSLRCSPVLTMCYS